MCENSDFKLNVVFFVLFLENCLDSFDELGGALDESDNLGNSIRRSGRCGGVYVENTNVSVSGNHEECNGSYGKTCTAATAEVVCSSFAWVFAVSFFA